MLDTGFAYVFMLMFWRPHLLSADHAYAYACAYALVKTCLNMSVTKVQLTNNNNNNKFTYSNTFWKPDINSLIYNKITSF